MQRRRSPYEAAIYEALEPLLERGIVEVRQRACPARLPIREDRELGGGPEPLHREERIDVEAERRGHVATIGGWEYLQKVIETVPSSANVEYHARIVKEKALRRRLIEVAQGLVVEAHESPADASVSQYRRMRSRNLPPSIW